MKRSNLITPLTFARPSRSLAIRRVLAAIESVTNRKKQGETYDEFVKRAASNPIGGKVKLADLRDNSDISRIANPTAKDYKRLEKYRNAIKTIDDMD